MAAPPLGGSRSTVFAPRIAALLREHTGSDAFRLEPDTVGVAGAELMDALLAARPAGAGERPTFKPVLGRSVPRADAAALMQAVSADVRAALKRPAGTPDLTGPWPLVPHQHLRDLVFGRELWRLRVLVDRRLELTPKLTWSAVTTGAALLARPGQGTPMSNLARRVFAADTFADRRYHLYLYRRVAAPVCFTVAALVTNAVWLGAPFAEGVPNAHILHEALRLLPPSWNILRLASPEFPGIDPRIGPADDVLLLPLLSHRDPRYFADPHAFRPERWAELDPETHPGYLPFGPAGERCWGRHLVLPLAERLLTAFRRSGLRIDPAHRTGRIDLGGLLELATVRVLR